MGDTKTIDDIIKKEIRIRNLATRYHCILELSPRSYIASCSNYNKEHCRKSTQRKNCNYVKKNE